MFDKGLEYDSKIKEIELLIYKLGNIGFNCTNLVNSLNKIKEDAIISLDNIRNNKEIDAPVKHMLLDGVYTESLGKLKDLEIIIYEDEKYCKVMNKLSDLNILINSNTLNRLSIEIYVNELIECIKIVRNSSIKDHREKEKITDYLYEIVYKMIKIELKLTGKSKLLDYCSLYDIDVSNLNELVLGDIKNQKENKRLNNVLNELNDLDDDYLDKGLITLLSNVSTEEELESVKLKLKEIILKYKENNLEITKLEEEKKDIKLYDKKYRKRQDVSEDIKELFINTGLFLLSAGISFGLIKGASSIKHNHKVYNVTTYTQNDDSYNYDEVEYCAKKDVDELAIKIYEPYILNNGKYVRTVKTYLLKENPFITNLEDYLNIDLEEYNNLRYYTSTEKKDVLEESDFYTENIVQVIENNEKEIIKVKCSKGNAIYVILTSLLIALFEIYSPFILEFESGLEVGVVRSFIKICLYIAGLIIDLSRTYSSSEIPSDYIKEKLKVLDEEMEKLTIENEELNKKYKEILSLYRKEYKSLFNKNDDGLSRTLSR